MSNTEALARAVIHARDTYGWSPEVDGTIEALRAALAQQPAASEQPVAYSIGRTLHWHEGKGRTNAQLYAAPQPAPARVPLTAYRCEDCGSVLPNQKCWCHAQGAKEGSA